MGEKVSGTLTINGYDFSKLPEFQETYDGYDGVYGLLPEPCEMKFQLKRMSRKRYIKQLMSIGVSRNAAVASAKEAWFHDWEYASAFIYYVITREVKKDG